MPTSSAHALLLFLLSISIILPSTGSRNMTPCGRFVLIRRLPLAVSTAAGSSEKETGLHTSLKAIEASGVVTISLRGVHTNANETGHRA